MEKTLKVLNPYSGVMEYEYKYNTFKEVEKIIADGRDAYTQWASKDIGERIKEVRNALEYFKKNVDSVARDISSGMGRPLQQAKGEINGLLERGTHLCDIAKEELKSDILPEKEGFSRRIDHCPLGVVFVIAPWNYPLLTAINSIAVALLSGNTVILKHASATTAVGAHFQKAFGNLSGVENTLQQIVVDHSTTQKIIEQLPLDFVVFTGSVTGGQKIYKSVSERFIDCSLELGGKDAAYVADDADLLVAAETLVDGAMYNSGQSCCGIERVYVHSDLYTDFVNRCQEIVGNYKLGDPCLDTTNMGPLYAASAAKIMEEQIKEAKDKGAKIISGGKKTLIGKGTFFEPTIVSDVDNSMMLMQEENFGPIMPVMQVASIDEAIGFINDCDYGLTASIFTADVEKAERFAGAVDAGTIFKNRCDYLDPALAWIGMKNSGKGLSLSKYSFKSLTRCKSIHFKD